MKFSFAALDPQQALHVAIFIEERNAERYSRFASMFVEFGDCESLEIADVFWEMAVEERCHSSLLQGKYLEHYGNARCALTEEHLTEFIELPRLENGNVFGPSDGVDFLPPRERALQVALQAELSARSYYESLMETTRDGPLCALYRELAQLEDGHVTYLQQKLLQLSLADKRAS